MDQIEGDEIDVLRRRAYGPRADIHLDVDALRRLRELESQQSGTGESLGEAAAPEKAGERLPVDAAQTDPTEDEGDADRAAPKRARFRLRRSTVVVTILGIVLVVISAALVLVERVQSDPLLVGATQIGRVAVDSSYRVPNIFGSRGWLGANVADGRRSSAYQDFHGLRAVIDGSKDPCMTVYRAADATDPMSDSFSGSAFSGCAAGRFPAMVQFNLDDSLPTDICAAFSRTTALQFVYDRTHDEVAVFATK